MNMRSVRLLAVAALATAGLTVPPWSSPVTASVAPAVASPPGAALDWIEDELAANGGTLPSSFDPSATDWGLTLDALIALHAGGRGDGATAASAIAAFEPAVGDYVTGEAFGDVGSAYAGPIGKSLYTVGLLDRVANTVSAFDLEQLSRDAITPSGTFAGRFSDVSSFGDFSNGFGQAFNIMGLALTDGGVPAAAIDFLVEQQCPAGGFRLTYAATRGCETDAEADTDATAFAVSALVAVDATPVTDAAIDAATMWLLDRQDDATGGFGGTGPTANLNANTTALAAKALRAVGELEAAGRAAAFVVSLQLDATAVTGTPVAGETGAIALDAAVRADALANGIAPAARDQWRRATTQGVLALEAAPAVTPLEPARLLDTRPGEVTVDGLQVGAGAVAAGGELVLPVAGRGGVPVGASGVVLNVTALGASGPGFVTVYGCGDRPTASNLNFGVGTVQPNLVVSGLDADGSVCLFVGGTGSVQLIVDVTGFVDVSSDLSPVVPARLLDTRPGEVTVDGLQVGAGAVAAGGELVLPVAGRGGVPVGASGVVLNVTALGASGPGFVTVYGCGDRPTASNLNFGVGTVQPNLVVSGLDADGSVCLFVGGTGSVQLIVDVTGFVDVSSDLSPVVPARLLDTRPGEVTVDGLQVGAGAVAAGGELVLPVAGRGGVPVGASGVVLNVTALGASGPGFVTVYGCGDRPTASNLNFGVGTVQPNLVVSGLDADGSVCLFVGGTGSVQLIVDVTAVLT
jgi:hypothetical protein